MPTNELYLETVKARQILEAYHERRHSSGRRPMRTKLEETNTELSAINCYLNRFTIPETVEFIAKNCGVEVSRNTVGRMFRDLFLAKVR
jgi:hypothetical protein